MAEPARESFGADELAVVLSHYDLGTLESITEFNRGSRRCPKVGVVSERGKFLLKRRPLQKNDAKHVDFSHELQTYLTTQDFPLPRLVPDKLGETALRFREHLYELFEFVAGHSFRHLPSESREAGKTLARFHALTRDFRGREEPRTGDYHDSLGVRTGLNSLPNSLGDHESIVGREGEMLGTVHTVFDVYEQAAEYVKSLGLEKLPEQVIHSDWHPGNMLFRHEAVVAVIDYDAVRRSRTVLDVANGMLQFSMLGGNDPREWPDHLDEERLSGFLAGYQILRPLCDTERMGLVPLMIEALVAECVPPIMATGAFGPWHGFGFLKMVLRKIHWLRREQIRLTSLISIPNPVGG